MREAAKRTRRAVIVDKRGRQPFIELREAPSEDLHDGSIRVAPEYVGICGSDLEQLRGNVHDSFDIPYPHIIGHEWSGEIVELSEDVRPSLQVGDRVVGHGDLGDGRWFGVSRDGSMAESFVVPASFCFKVPNDIDLVTAALIEPLACCVAGLRAAAVAEQTRMRVLVLGCGPLGLSMVALLHHRENSVSVSDPSALRCDLASALGASGAVAPSDVPESSQAGWDLVVETSGSPTAQANALDVVRPGGCVLLMGLGMRPASSVPLYRIQTDGIMVKASTGAPATVWPEAIGNVIAYSMSLKQMVTDIYTIDACAAAFDAAGKPEEHGKVMVAPSAKDGFHR